MTIGTAAVLLFDLALISQGGTDVRLSMSVVTALGQPPSPLTTVQVVEYRLNEPNAPVGPLPPEQTQSFIEEKPRERSRTSMFHAVSATGPIVSFSLDLKTNELVSILFHPNSGYALDEKQLRQLPEAPIRAR